MDQKQLLDLINLWEKEWIELKEKKTQMDFNNLGEYFSALSNEANLKNQTSAFLILGVSNERNIVWTNYLESSEQQQKIKYEIAVQTNGVTFTEIHTIDVEWKRVLIFEIPPAIYGNPTSWKWHYYGRHWESLSPLTLQELETIRSQVKSLDRSKQIVTKASIAELDPEAIAFARKQFADRNPDALWIKERSDEVFLKKSWVMIDDWITNAWLILLGKKEIIWYSDSTLEMSWILKDEHNKTIDHKHFWPPFLLNIEKLTQNIRNLTVRQMPDGTLFPIEMEMYDRRVLREAINNAIAHQDYSLHARITISEYPDKLILINRGSFLPWSIETVINSNAPSRVYKNYRLTHIMYNFKMIDRMGSGVYNMFQTQRKRWYPLPSYHIANDEVTLEINGVVLNENYTKLILWNPNISLDKVILLDKLQKDQIISKEESDCLRKDWLIDGKYPKVFPSLHVAQVIQKSASYIWKKWLESSHYESLIIALLEKNPAWIWRDQIDDLLFSKLPDVYRTDHEKKQKISNYLTKLRVKGTIHNIWNDAKPLWKLSWSKENKKRNEYI